MYEHNLLYSYKKFPLDYIIGIPKDNKDYKKLKLVNKLSNIFKNIVYRRIIENRSKHKARNNLSQLMKNTKENEAKEKLRNKLDYLYKNKQVDMPQDIKFEKLM